MRFGTWKCFFEDKFERHETFQSNSINRSPSVMIFIRSHSLRNSFRVKPYSFLSGAGYEELCVYNRTLRAGKKKPILSRKSTGYGTMCFLLVIKRIFTGSVKGHSSEQHNFYRSQEMESASRNLSFWLPLHLWISWRFQRRRCYTIENERFFLYGYILWTIKKILSVAINYLHNRLTYGTQTMFTVSSNYRESWTR